MKRLIFAICIGSILAACETSGNTTNPDRTTSTPNDKYERVGGSVSPRSELENTDNHAGIQKPDGTNVDTILGPMNSASTRSAPDASYGDAMNRK